MKRFCTGCMSHITLLRDSWASMLDLSSLPVPALCDVGNNSLGFSLLATRISSWQDAADDGFGEDFWMLPQWAFVMVRLCVSKRSNVINFSLRN